MVPLMLVAAMTGVLASKHTGTLAVVGVITQAMTEEPLLVTVVMLVVEINFQLFHAGLQEVEIPSLRVRTSGTDKLQIRILGAQGVGELLQAGGKHRTIVAMGLVVVPLLITHSQIFQIERLWMAHVGTYLAPFGIDRTIGKLYQVEGILNIGVELIETSVNTRFRGVRVLELTGESTTDNGQRLAAKVFAELEELKETKAIALEIIRIEAIVESIVPAVFVERTVFNRTYRILPLITIRKQRAFYDTATREAEYAWMHIIQGLSQIFAHAILATFPSVDREEADVLYIGCGDGTPFAILAQEDAQGSLRLRTW